MHADCIDLSCLVKGQKTKMKRPCQRVRVDGLPKCVSLEIILAEDHQINVSDVKFVPID